MGADRGTPATPRARAPERLHRGSSSAAAARAVDRAAHFSLSRGPSRLSSFNFPRSLSTRRRPGCLFWQGGVKSDTVPARKQRCPRGAGRPRRREGCEDRDNDGEGRHEGANGCAHAAAACAARARASVCVAVAAAVHARVHARRVRACVLTQRARACVHGCVRRRPNGLLPVRRSPFRCTSLPAERILPCVPRRVPRAACVAARLRAAPCPPRRACSRGSRCCGVSGRCVVGMSSA